MKTKETGIGPRQNSSCGRESGQQPLRLQKELSGRASKSPLLPITAPQGSSLPAIVGPCRREQYRAILKATSLFEAASAQTRLQIEEIAQEKTFPAQTVLFRAGDAATSFYLVLEGKVRISQLSPEGVEIHLADFGPGEGFGEMAVLLDRSRSAVARTLEASRLLVLTKKEFTRLVGEDPHLAKSFARLLADRLRNGNVCLARAYATERAYQQFVSDHYASSQLELIGDSRSMAEIKQRCRVYGQNRRPVLVLGPPGTEKKAVSWEVHQASGNDAQPFLVMDAKTAELEKEGLLAGAPESLQLEHRQESILFGYPEKFSAVDGYCRIGFLQIGCSGTVVIENIEYLAESVQTRLAHFILSGRLPVFHGGEVSCSANRIIATSTADLADLVGSRRFSPMLYRLLHKQIVVVSPLHKRKKDLRPLVNYLIRHFSRQAGKEVSGLEQQAYKDIMAYGWPGNRDELEVVVRRAVNLAEGSKLCAEDLFLGPAPVADTFTFDLLKIPFVRGFFTSHAYPGLFQGATAFFFVMIIVMGFFGSQVSGHNLSLVLTWGIWEPFIVFSALVGARIWCAVCPVGALNSFLAGCGGSRRKVPSFLRQYGHYFAAAGICLIFWFQSAANLYYSPRATALLIAVIGLLATFFGLLYQRRTWCRYLCPLGKLLGVVASCSVTEMRCNADICNHDCGDHLCYAGREEKGGCPVFEAPFALKSNQNCILCGNCIKACRHQSPVFNLRLPGRELLVMPMPDATLSVLSLALIASQLFRGLEMSGQLRHFSFAGIAAWAGYGAAMTVILASLALFTRLAGWLTMGRQRDFSVTRWQILTYACIPLAVAFECGYQLERALERGGKLLLVLLHNLGYGQPAWVGKSASADPVFLQLLLLSIGWIVSAALLDKELRTYGIEVTGRLLSMHKWPLACLAMLYVFFFWIG